jgi:hypothetical protein
MSTIWYGRRTMVRRSMDAYPLQKDVVPLVEANIVLGGQSSGGHVTTRMEAIHRGGIECPIV